MKKKSKIKKGDICVIKDFTKYWERKPDTLKLCDVGTVCEVKAIDVELGTTDVVVYIKAILYSNNPDATFPYFNDGWQFCFEDLEVIDNIK